MLSTEEALGFETEKLCPCCNGVLVIMRERVMAVSFLLITKWSLIVYVCAHTWGWVGEVRQKRERRKEREAVTLPVWRLGTDMHH